MTERNDLAGETPGEHSRVVTHARLALYRAALKRSMRRVAAYRRWLRPRRYSLKQYDRMLVKLFNPMFLFPKDTPVGQKVLIVLPHQHEAGKIGGLVRMLIARDEGGQPPNRIHAVVIMPSHRGLSATDGFRKREDMIDAINKEALDWAHVIGLDLGVPPWDPNRRLKDPVTELPLETAYARQRVGDQFIYGPDGAYRFFNAWKTYDSGEHDPNRQAVAPEDQRAFCALVQAEDPDIVLLPDRMDPHPSHRTSREITMEALRSLLAERHARGIKRVVTLMEYASFHLLTPPRYNLWVVVPKEFARLKTEANKVFRLQKQHDYETDQILAERVTSMAAGDEFSFARSHPEKAGFAMRLSQSAPAVLPANVTAENFTVNLLRVVIRRGIPVVLESRAANPRKHLLSMRTTGDTTG